MAPFQRVSVQTNTDVPSYTDYAAFALSLDVNMAVWSTAAPPERLLLEQRKKTVSKDRKGAIGRGKSWRSVLGASHRAKAIFSSTEPVPQRLSPKG